MATIKVGRNYESQRRIKIAFTLMLGNKSIKFSRLSEVIYMGHFTTADQNKETIRALRETFEETMIELEHVVNQTDNNYSIEIK